MVPSNIVNITPEVRFSLNTCKGSAQDRKNLATNINEQIFEEVLPKFQEGALKVSDFEDALYNNLPEDKYVEVVGFELKEDDDVDGLSSVLEDDDNNYIGQTIEIPMDDGKISRRPLVTLFHETRHVLDTLSNPKYLARTKAMYANDLYTRAYYNMYDRLYNDIEDPTPENTKETFKDLKKRLNRFLRGKPVEDQINSLQDLRYTLETERNAFADQYKFECRLNEKGINTGDYELEDEAQYYFFDEKIDMLKEKTAQIIKKERERLRSK